MRHKPAADEKPLHWVGSSKADLLEFPRAVVREIGWALGVAQLGVKHPAAKRWKGAGPRVLEIVENYDGNTYRAIYTVRFPLAVYVLHCFQKKSPRDTETAKTDIDLVHQRLRAAQADYEVRHGKEQK
ncbi:MAG: type II toxin-antitoxin system RelE/ParE family toxin [Steroidobacteraceae bacterium]